jgi:alpha-tubulin suppressor-like RCC1 family protein
LAVHGRPLEEITISGNGVTIADGDTTPTTTDHTGFGSVFLTGGTVTRTFTISSTGFRSLNLTGTPKVEIGGADAADFTVISQPASPIVPFTGVTTFQISFDPSALGFRNATVSIVNNDGVRNPYNFNIQGAGLNAPTFVYNSATDVPLTTSSVVLSGNANFTLNFAPVPGTNLTMVKNTGTAFIQGAFSNVANGAVVNLSFNGITYPFIAWYYGGDGNNDLVLLWPHTGLAAWGKNGSGQFGDNTMRSRQAPAAVDQKGVLAGKTIVQIVSGGDHTLALTSEGRVYAWGSNGYGQLGDNTTTNRNAPVAVNTVSGTSALFGKTVMALATGEGHSLALCSDGTLAAWGYNLDGELGDNTSTNRSAPVVVNASSGLSVLFGRKVVAISAGGYHSLALCSDGTLAAWGSNDNGQLGDNTTTNRNAPVAIEVTSGSTSLFGKTVVSITAGGKHSVARCSDGTLAAWGDNAFGQLGDNTTIDCATPVAVSTSSGTSFLFGKSVVAVTAGIAHNLALCSDGTLVAWGGNDAGQLGDKTIIDRQVPVEVNAASGSSALFTKTVVSIAAGRKHSLGLCSDGTFAAWGNNEFGQLGDSSTTNRPAAVAVSRASGISVLADRKISGLVASGSQASHALAIYGRPLEEITISGNGVTIADDDTIPTTADHTGFGNVFLSGAALTRTYTINSSGYRSLNLTGTPKVEIGGVNASDFTVITQPASPLVPFTGVTTFQISFDPSALGPRNATVSIASNDSARTPYNFNIQGTCINAPAFVYNSAADVPLTTSSVVLSGDASLTLNFAPEPGTNLTMVKNTGTAFIQGSFNNVTNGASVNLSFNGITYPFIVWYYGGDGNDLVLLWPYTGLAAWGRNHLGQLGDGTTTDRSVPVAVEQSGVLAGKTIVQVISGIAHTLALTSEGRVYAWGENGSGQLGNNTTTASAAPVAVNTASGTSALFGKTVVAIAAGYSHSLALCSDGTLTSWGYNSFGALGDNTSTNRSAPVVVNAASGTSALFGRSVVAIAAGYDFSLALCSDGSLVAWGSNFIGQLGEDTKTSRFVPVAVNVVSGISALYGKTVISLTAGGFHSMALCSDGTIAAWGGNLSGQLGDNSSMSSSVPMAVNAVSRASWSGALYGKVAVGLAAAHTHSLALFSDGTLAAWGDDSSGQLGDNSGGNQRAPVMVNMTSGTSALFGKSVGALSTGYSHSLALCFDGSIAAWGDNDYGQLGDNTLLDRHAPVLVNTTSGISVLSGRRVIGLAKASAGAGHSLAIYGVPRLEMTVSGNLLEIAHGDLTPSLADHTDFDGANLTGGSVVRSFTIANIGLYPLNLTGTSKILLGGDHAADFSVSAQPVSPLAFNRTTTFQITFDPSALGIRRATVSIANDDGDENPYTFNIQGTGTEPEITVEQSQGVALSQGGLSQFRPVPVGSSADLVFTVKNTGGSGSRLTGLGITLDGADAGQFSLVSSPVTPVAGPDGAATFVVRYRPTSSGAKSAALHITSNDGDENPFDIQLAGTTAASVSAVFNAESDVGSIFNTLNAAGLTLDLTLNYAPTMGANLMAVKSTGTGFIQGSFSNVANGATVQLSFNGTTYPFIAWYYGGDGNDLVLLWPYTGLAAWGMNESGQLGDGERTYDRSVPVAVEQGGVLAGKTIVQVSSGGAHTLALTSEGQVYAWGNNSSGQLGDNTTMFSSVPVAVNTTSGTSALFGKSVVAIATGGLHSLALCSDGILVAWGNNFGGQLGDNTMADRSVPVAVNRVSGTSALFGKTVAAISAGSGHSLALCSDGTLVAWGYNNYGQLGDGALTNRLVPVAVNRVSGTSALYGKTVAAVSAGGEHNLVLCSDGMIAAWGHNNRGQLGDGSTIDRLVPVAVNTASGISALFGKGVVAIAAGGEHNLALCSDGSLAAWGSNGNGALGDTTVTDRFVPVAVSAASGVSALYGKAVGTIAAGREHSLALSSDGTVAAWGSDSYGRLGDNTWGSSSTVPVAVNTVSGTSVLANRKVLSLGGLGGSVDHSTVIYGAPLAGILISGNDLGIVSGDTTPGAADGTDFGRANPLEGSAVCTFTISNTGFTALNLTGTPKVVISGSHAADFSVTAQPVSPLAAIGSKTTFEITFAPSAVGLRQATLSIANDASDTNPYTFSIQGMGSEQEIAVEVEDGMSVADGGRVDLGNIGMASGTGMKSFTIKNEGTKPLTGLSMTKTGPDQSLFTVSALPDSIIPAISSMTFTVQVSVPAKGVKTAVLHIASNDRDESSYDITLTATGVTAIVPAATTMAATGVMVNEATLRGSVNANNLERMVYFDYGLTTKYGDIVEATPVTLTGTSLTNVSAAIGGLLPHTKYNFRVRASSSMGSASGVNMTFTTPNNAPVATDDSVAALPSSKLVISVLGNDGDPDGDTLSIASFTQPGAAVGTVAKVGGDLVFTPSATFTGGSFTYIASDVVGLKSNGATVTLTLGTCNLGYDVNIPSDSQPYDLSVSATAPFSVIESVPWLSFVPPWPGDVAVRFIPAPNPTKTSRTGTVKIGGKTHTVTQAGIPGVAFLEAPAVVPDGVISGYYDLPIVTHNGPVTYTVTGLPKGLTLSNSTGHITGFPTEAVRSSVIVSAANVQGISNTVRFDIIVRPFPASLAGSYSATIADSGPETDFIGGLMTMTVTSTGGVTGTLKLGTGSHPFTGRLNTAVDPLNPDPDHAALNVSVKRAGKPTVDLRVNMNTPSNDLISGLVDFGVELTGSKHVWNAATRPADAFKGRYTVALQPPDDVEGILPQGDGFLTYSVSAAGAVSWSGQLADGTVITAQTATLWANGDLPLFALLYSGKGALNQRINIAPNTKLVSGEPHWFKTPQAPTVRAYSGGFGPIILTAVGAEYLPPVAGKTLLNITAPGTAKIDFSDGGLGDVSQFADLDQVFSVSAAHAATFAGVNPAQVKLTKIDVTTGTFTGTMTLKDDNPFNAALPQVSRPVNFSGVLLPGSGIGTGYFLLPGIAGPPANVTTSPMTSGQVRVTP